MSEENIQKNDDVNASEAVGTVEEVWTEEDQAIYGPLRRKKLRIERRERLDKSGKRKKNFGVRPNRRGIPPTGKSKDE
jgi:hypothetical protein